MIKMSETSLTRKFRKWYKGRGKIIRIQQGDSNLIAVIFFDKDMRDYNVGDYIYRENASGQTTFMFNEIKERLTKQEAINKFNQIVEEF